MATKHPLCPECIYHRHHPEVCDQCEGASEFESAEARQAPKPAARIRVLSTEAKLESRNRITGIQDRAREIVAALEPTFKRMSDK